jgi:hypothetical protein
MLLEGVRSCNQNNVRVQTIFGQLGGPNPYQIFFQADNLLSCKMATSLV